MEVLMKVTSQIGKHVVAVVQSFSFAVQPRNRRIRWGKKYVAVLTECVEKVFSYLFFLYFLSRYSD